MSSDRIVLDSYSAPDEFQEGAGSITVETEWIDGPHRRVPETKTTLVRNQDGRLISKTVETWSYDDYGTGYPPTLYRKETYSTVWLPGVNEARALILTETDTTEFWIDAIFRSPDSELSYRRTVEGYVVYDLYQQEQTADTDAQATMEAQGRKVDSGNVGRRILSTARSWRDSIHEGSIIEDPEQPQSCYWQTMQTEEHTVTESWATVMEYTVRKDYLRPGMAEVDGPRYRPRDGVTYELPIPLPPPVIEARAAGADGVRLGVTAKPATWDVATPTNRTVRVMPTSVTIYRRTITAATIPDTGDRWGLLETDPGSPTSRMAPPFSETATDYSGTPIASSLPSQTSYSEDDPYSLPDDSLWEHVVDLEIDRVAAADSAELEHIDDRVDSGATYEYVAVSKLGSQQSDQSTPARIAYGGGATTASSLGVTIVTRGEETEVAVNAPPDPETSGIVEEYGETLDLGIMPAEIESATDAREIAEFVAEQQFLRDQGGRTLRITPAAPIFPLARGMLVTLSDTSWRWMADDVIGDVQSEFSTGVLEGWSLAATGDNDGLVVSAGELTVEVNR